MSTASLRALVVDDEPLARDELVFLLRECGIEVVGESPSASAALELCEQTRPNVVFVDLRMPGPDGIALAEAIRARYRSAQVVVVSAHKDGALRAFEAEVSDYLLKPVRLERLKKTLERLRSHQPGEATSSTLERIAVRRRGGYVVIDVRDVVYFEVRDELVWAVTDEDRFALDLTLAAVEQGVPEGMFFRSHRGVLVRFDRICAIEPSGSTTYELRLQHPSDPRVPLARERARLLRERIPFA